MKHSRRGRLLIEPYKQLRFGMMFLFLNLIFGLSAFLVFAYYLWDVYQAVSSYFALTGAEQAITMAKFAKPIGIVGAMVVLFIICTLWLSVRYTHQFYGPLVAIRRYLDQLIAGESPEPISLRENDQLQDIVAKLNQYAAKVEKSD